MNPLFGPSDRDSTVEWSAPFRETGEGLRGEELRGEGLTGREAWGRGLEVRRIGNRVIKICFACGNWSVTF